MPNKLYSTRQAAAAIGLHPTTVRIYSQKGGCFHGIGEVIGHSRIYLNEDIEKMRAILEKRPEPGRKPTGASGKPLSSEERYRVAFQMRQSGKSLEVIRAKLGYTKISSVSRAIKISRRRAEAAEAEA